MGRAANSRLVFSVEIVEPLKDGAIVVSSTNGFEVSSLSNPLLRLVMSAGVLLRRRRDANWFALIGGIVEPGTVLTRSAERGEFVCFLNDAPQRYFHDNNHGKVKLTLSVPA